MSEEYFIRYGSPTLAGIKTGSLFMCPIESDAEAVADLSAYNHSLVPKGLCMIPLRFLGDRVLVYMFRPKRLARDLADPEARRILRQRGYKSLSPMGLLAELRERICDDEDFPHEIGLFLGYPAEDVRGFIEHDASDYQVLGTWKVYGDRTRAEKCFDAYRKCTESLSRQLSLGKTLSDLTVAM